MSWKSFVTAGLLCVIASPVFAAPTVQIVPGGTFASNRLNADGDWVWNVRLSQTTPLIDIDNMGGAGLPLGSPLGAELGFQETASELLGATNLADGFGTDNPGRKITGWDWLTLTATGGTGDCNTGTAGLCPTGLQSDTATDQVFAAIGSVDYLSDTDGKGFIQIVVDGPSTTGSLTTNLEMLGAYSGNGRISELNDAFDPNQPTSGSNPYSVNYDTFAGTTAFTAKAGDANLDNSVGAADYNIWLANVGVANAKWYQGDFNGDGSVGAGDYNIWLANVGAGSGSGGAVPEPATLALVALAGLGVFGLRRRNG